MDLIYGSRENDNDIQIFKLGTKKFLYTRRILVTLEVYQTLNS